MPAIKRKGWTWFSAIVLWFSRNGMLSRISETSSSCPRSADVLDAALSVPDRCDRSARPVMPKPFACLNRACGLAFPLDCLDSDQCGDRRACHKFATWTIGWTQVTHMKSSLSKTWALVLNGTRCRILRGVSGPGEDVPVELVLRSESRNLRDIMSDKPGRSFSSGGHGRRSAMEYGSDPVAEDQREFIRQIIALLESHRRAGDFDKLAIFAEHDMLGELRQMIPQTLADLVIREVPKNLLHLSPQDLAEAVSRGLPDGSGTS